jgi:pimeloyl-ACP methyl ester carboxylesterase
MGMQTVTSRDGTRIAYDLRGSGPGIVFAPGVFNDHTRCADLASALASDHTVIVYDRRGRGESGDTPPYAIEREVEDIAALASLCDGPVTLFGYSSGAILGLLAASSGVDLGGLVMFEPPYAFSRPVDTGLPGRLAAMVAEGRRGDAVATFQAEAIGLPPEVIAHIRESPMWPALEAMAPSMIYDATITMRLAVPTAEMVAATTPALIMYGGSTWPVLRDAAQELAKVMPAARLLEVDAANHDIPTDETAELIRTHLG